MLVVNTLESLLENIEDKLKSQFDRIDKQCEKNNQICS